MFNLYHVIVIPPQELASNSFNPSATVVVSGLLYQGSTVLFLTSRVFAVESLTLAILTAYADNTALPTDGRLPRQIPSISSSEIVSQFRSRETSLQEPFRLPLSLYVRKKNH
ncbi:hypothetical protein Droror1_Dr00007551 [Drosera rotundifolia]